MVASGVVNVYILEEGEVMDRFLYTDLVEDYFDRWRLGCEYLVCDYESCLRTPEALAALRKIGMQLVDGYPKVSQDFNALANVWGIIKKRLLDTCPVKLETRVQFIARLKAAVRWINRRSLTTLWNKK